MHDPPGRTDGDGFGAVSEHFGSTDRTTLWSLREMDQNSNAMAARMLTVDNIVESVLMGLFPQALLFQWLVISDSIWRGVCDVQEMSRLLNYDRIEA